MRPSSFVAAAAICLPLLMLGCAPQPTAPPLQGKSPAAEVQIEAMTPDAKRSTIATSFPIEVPVPVGQFTRAQAQGSDAWDYVVRVPSSPEALLDWYRQAYTSRQWVVVSERDFEGSGSKRPGQVLTLRKGNSESEVAVDSAADQNGVTTARVILGVGAPVLETQ